MRVAIMQPTYLPWPGYFGLMQSVDLFIVLDSVQFAKRSWQQRNRIKSSLGPIWLTVPIETKGKRSQKICEARVNVEQEHGQKHAKTLRSNYAKAQHFDEYGPELISKLEKPETLLVDLNLKLLLHCRELLGIKTPIMRSSEMQGSGVRAELLASLCAEVNASEYISPPGSKEYLIHSNAFEKLGIPVRYFSYDQREYTQLFGEFMPYLSVVDLILNCGSASIGLVQSGSKVFPD